MSVYAPLVRNILHPLDLLRSGDTRELRYTRDFLKTQFLSKSELEELALGQFQRLVEDAYKNCPFYRSQFEAAGVIPSDLKSLADVSALPVLEKRQIQANRDEMINKQWPSDDLRTNQTGGSTGEPISFFLSRDRQWSRDAMKRRHDGWAGYRIGDKIAIVWGAPLDIPRNTTKQRLRNALIDRTLFFNTAQITEAKCKNFHEELKRFRPTTILGYARSMLLLAMYAKSHGISAYQPRSIITSAEYLEPADRELLTEVFGCPIFDRYGCREFSVIASECSHHQGLHIGLDAVYLEIDSNGRPAEPGELGSILVTDLRNLAMPMIRYRIGDMGALETSDCSCGRGLPLLRSIAGRITDFLVATDGRLVSGAFLTTVVAKRPTLGQVQIRQAVPERVLYRICGERQQMDANNDLQFLQNETKRLLGGETTVDFEFVDELPPESSGKFLYCHSSAASDFVNTGHA